MEARGIEPHTSANRKYLNAQDARIQALGPGSLPALCAFSALGALVKGQIRHNGDQSANSLCSSLAPDVTNQLNPRGAFTNWPCRGTPRRAVTCCASLGLPETTSTWAHLSTRPARNAAPSAWDPSIECSRLRRIA